MRTLLKIKDAGKKTKGALFAVSLAFGGLGMIAPAPAHAAGTVILEGSDAIGFHCGFGQTTACDYANQTWTALGGSSSKSIAVVGATSSGNPVTSATHAIQTFADLSTAGDLNDYVAIYFLGEGGCCDSGPEYMAGRQSDIADYVNGGGTVEIGNYDGVSDWDFLTGGTGNASFVGGVGGILSGPGCSDGETVNATGLINGFTQPGTIGCWTHQGYSQPHFAALGFTKSFFDSDPAFASLNPGFGPFSSLLSNGNTQTGVDNGAGDGVPEPSNWAMMIAGFGIVGGAARVSRRKASLATA